MEISDNSAETPINNNEVPKEGGQPACESCSTGSVGRVLKNSAYGVLVVAFGALIFTAISPETAVAVSQYLPDGVQQTIFGSPASGSCGGSMSANLPLTSFGSCCASQATCSMSGGSCPMAVAESGCQAGPVAPQDVVFMPLSLDDMLEGVTIDQSSDDSK